jgi:hypothetical protein
MVPVCPLQTLRIFVVLLIAGLLPHLGEALAQPTSYPLIQQSDLQYQGAFLLPSWTSDATSFSYGGTALAYNPAQHSLFLVGHDQYQRTAEVRIPPPVQSATLSALPRATFLQPFTEVTEGNLPLINPSDPNAKNWWAPCL